MNNQIFLSDKFKIIGGVCSGIAVSKGISIALVRLIALFFLSTGLGLILYLCLWIFLPKASERRTPEPSFAPHDPFTRSSDDRVLGGVCGGLAKVVGWDPIILRVVFFILFISGGFSLVPYVYAWLALPLEPQRVS